MTNPEDDTPPPEDPWTALLRRNREAGEMIRQRLAAEPERVPDSRGLPCE